MMSVREVLTRPQVISTDRHVMQGLLELDKLTWDADKGTLSGTVRLPAGDPVTITMATNGFEAVNCSAGDPVGATLEAAAGASVVKLRLVSDDNRVASWKVGFRK